MKNTRVLTKRRAMVFCSLLMLMALMAQPAWAGTHWFSVDRQERPSGLPATKAQAAAASVKVFDVVVSLHNDPDGDDDQATPDDRTPYEDIIEYFADGVYEQSNGAHKIGKVRIYLDGDYSSKCDILWTASGHPRATPSGRGNSGRIRMFSQFGSTNFLQSEADGGFTLAHEWGHYTYALYDEYKGSPGATTAGGTLYDDILYFPHSTDDADNVSIMNSQWRATTSSGGFNYDWLNFSTSTRSDYTNVNAQYRIYDAAAWQTLIRPVSEDSRTGDRRNLATRVYYSELKAVAPTGNAHVIDLPSSEAQSQLEIIWMDEDSDLVYQIVIDCSGSMGSSAMTNAKTAANVLVDLAEEGKAIIGVLKFNSGVTTVASLTKIDSQATKDSIKSKINTIYSGGSTAIGEAAQRALDSLLARGQTDDTQVVFLLSDGQSNSGRSPLSVIPAYQAAQIPLFTFAYGSGADQGTLRKMADDTGGSFYVSPTTLAEITQVFSEANQQASQSRGIQSASSSLDQAEAFLIPVDSTLKRLDLVVTCATGSANAEIILYDPSGAEVPATSVTQSGNATLYQFGVDNPASGVWKLAAASFVGPVEFSYQASGLPADQISYSLSLDCLTGTTVQYPEPIVLLATLEKELPIANAIVSAQIKAPDGTVSSVELKDNGIAPDAVKDDGNYSTILDYDQGGVHEITVTMENPAGTARLTYNGLQPAPDISGYVPEQLPDIPVTEDFSRTAYLQVTVEGAQSDDHGNDAVSATPLPLDNTDVPGKIDYAADLDFFAIDIATGTGAVAIRVSNFALGMNPVLRILGSNGTTVISKETVPPFSPYTVGYLYVETNVPAGGRIYAEITHTDSSAETGTYQISAGPALASELAQADTLPITIQKCKAKAGKKDNTDSISFSGLLYATSGDLTAADTVDVKIWSIGDQKLVYSESFPVSDNNIKKGKYTSPKNPEKSAPKTSFKLDTNKNKFSFVAKNLDLTGLNCPVLLDITIGNYIGTGTADEDIVNGKKPIPIQFMMGVKDSLRVDKAKVKFGKKESSDSLSVKGAFTVENLQAFQNGLAAGDPIVVILGSVNITVSGKMAKFDPVKCTFTINIKGLNITEDGQVDFRINFFGITVLSPGTIDLGPKRAYALEELRLYDVGQKTWDYQSTYAVKGTAGSYKGVETATVSTGGAPGNYWSTYNAPGEWERLYWYTGTGGGIYVSAWDGENDICDFEFDTDLQVAPALLRLGQSFTDTAAFTGNLDVYVDDADVAISNLNGTVKSTCKLARHEQVTVPEGTFTAARIDQTYVINGTMDVVLDGWFDTTGKVSIKIKVTSWAVPGIGIVKEKATMSMKLTAKGAGRASVKITNTDVLTGHSN